MEHKEAQEIIDQGIEKLIEELRQGKSERLKNYLEFCSNFRKYSFKNTMLIYAQMPGATKIASYVEWNKLGFRVKEKCKIRIFAPAEYKYIEAENGAKINFKNMTEEQRANTKEHKKGKYFVLVPVFDISQTINVSNEDGDFFGPLGDSHKEQYLNLKDIVIEKKIDIVETEDTNGAEGVSYGGLIKIKESLDFNNKLLTLIHEFAHEILDKGAESDRDKTTSKIRECRAEAVSYIVGNYLGLNNPFSSDYLIVWGNTRESINEHMTAILKAINIIIEAIEEKKACKNQGVA